MATNIYTNVKYDPTRQYGLFLVGEHEASLEEVMEMVEKTGQWFVLHTKGFDTREEAEALLATLPKAIGARVETVSSLRPDYYRVAVTYTGTRSRTGTSKTTGLANEAGVKKIRRFFAAMAN